MISMKKLVENDYDYQKTLDEYFSLFLNSFESEDDESRKKSHVDFFPSKFPDGTSTLSYTIDYYWKNLKYNFDNVSVQYFLLKFISTVFTSTGKISVSPFQDFKTTWMFIKHRKIGRKACEEYDAKTIVDGGSPYRLLFFKNDITDDMWNDIKEMLFDSIKCCKKDNAILIENILCLCLLDSNNFTEEEKNTLQYYIQHYDLYYEIENPLIKGYKNSGINDEILYKQMFDVDINDEKFKKKSVILNLTNYKNAVNYVSSDRSYNNF